MSRFYFKNSANPLFFALHSKHFLLRLYVLERKIKEIMKMSTLKVFEVERAEYGYHVRCTDGLTIFVGVAADGILHCNSPFHPSADQRECFAVRAVKKYQEYRERLKAYKTLEHFGQLDPDVQPPTEPDYNEELHF